MSKMVSIIVPIYNAEKYLEDCLDSIIKQTYKNLEIILINDGSTDSSLKICKKYKEKDSRIVICDKKNEGISATRNKGIELAKGDYIGYVDSDDVIKPNMYETLVNKLEKHSDVDFVTCSLEMIYPDGRKTYPVKQDSDEQIYNEHEYRKQVYLEKTNIACWSKLFKRDFIKKYSFKTGVTNEDFVLLHDMTQKKLKVLSIKDVLYQYIVREGSLSSTGKAYHDGVNNAYKAMISEEKNGDLIREARSLYFIQSDYFFNHFKDNKKEHKDFYLPMKREIRKRLLDVLTNEYLYKKQRLRLFYYSLFY